MSNSYAIFQTQSMDDCYPCDMTVTAYVGKSKKDIQLTLRSDFICLDEKQVKNLIKVLQARLDSKITATGSEDMGLY